MQSQARAAAEDDEADAGDDTTKYGPRPEALVPEDGTLAAAGRAQLGMTLTCLPAMKLPLPPSPWN